MKAKALITCIFLFLFLLLTVLSNPPEREFISWLKEHDNPPFDLEMEVFATSTLEAETTTKNYLLFSIYNTNLPNGENEKTLGIFNNFFELSNNE